jgi:hypothetical protein
MEETYRITSFPKSPPQHFCSFFPDCLRIPLDQLALREYAIADLSERRDEVIPLHDRAIFRE